MDFNLNDKQKAIRDMARKFAAEVIVPRAAEMERSEEHPYDVIAKMGELGMMGIPFPSRYGGKGRGLGEHGSMPRGNCQG